MVCIFFLKEWTKQRKIETQLHKMGDEVLEKHLRQFYAEVKNKQGEDSKSTQWRSQPDNLVMLCKFFCLYRL